MALGEKILDQGFDKLSTGFGHYLMESIFEPSGSKGKKQGATFSALFFVALMTYAGVEFVKIIFRKNFGKMGLNSVKLVLVGLILAVVAAVAFFSYGAEETTKSVFWRGTKNIEFWTGILYSFLLIYVAIVGFKEKGKNVHAIHPAYRGTSKVFKFMINEGWKPSKVQDLIEPLSLLALGVALLPFSILLGAPFIFFSISYWLHLFVEGIMDFHAARENLANQGHRVDEESGFVEVI
jgi:hypothetical protein